MTYAAGWQQQARQPQMHATHSYMPHSYTGPQFAVGDYLLHKRHQIIGDTARMLAHLTTGMGTNGIEIPQ